jgi:hypothetical protein
MGRCALKVRVSTQSAQSGAQRAQSCSYARLAMRLTVRPRRGVMPIGGSSAGQAPEASHAVCFY